MSLETTAHRVRSSKGVELALALHDLIEELAAVHSGADLREVRSLALGLLNASEADVRWRAAEIVGLCGSNQDVGALADASRDPDPLVRATVFSALAQVGGGASLIIGGLSDNDPITRRYAAVALYDLLGCDAAAIIRIHTSMESDPLALTGIYFVLAACGDPEARHRLEDLALNESPRVYEAARSALEELREME